MKLYLKMLRLPQHLLAVPPLFGILDSGISVAQHPSVIFFTLGWLFSSISAFAYNDYVDSLDTDKHNQADIRASHGQKIDPKIILSLVCLISLISLICYLLSGPIGLTVGVATWLLMMIYSFPPLRLKKIKYLDILDQAVAWAVIPYFAPSIITRTPINSLIPFLFMISFLTAASAVAPILDISADKMGGIFNTTVAWGYEKSIRLSSRLLLLALILGLILIYKHTNPWYWVMLPPGFMAMKVLGMGQANSDRPQKLEALFLRAKKWGKFLGAGLFLFLLILITVQSQ